MREQKDLKSKKDYEYFLEEAISFFENKDCCYSDSALSILNLFKENVVVKRSFKDKNLLRIEVEEALEAPYTNSINNFIARELNGIEQEYLSIAFYGATIYERLVD